MKLSELPLLIDIFDTLEPEYSYKEHFEISDKEIEDLSESVLLLVEDYIVDNIKIFNSGNDSVSIIKEFITTAIENMYSFFHSDNTDEFTDDYWGEFDTCKQELTEYIYNLFTTIVPVRSLPDTRILLIQTDRMKHEIDKRIKYIREKDKSCPPQRSMEWHQQRYNLISASTAWKILDKDCYRDAYIYDKCKPLNTDKFNFVNIHSPFHWGTKFEPVSQMYYEYKYGVTIEEFGCIGHREISCMGASPDGIVTTRESDRYGRMVEIKNIVNRDITGIPKKEYWVQTQFQMECCNLDECDFLECRFKLYETKSDFDKDGNISKE